MIAKYPDRRNIGFFLSDHLLILSSIPREDPDKPAKMDPEQITVLSPMGLAFVVLMAGLLLALPRRLALLPIILTACYMTFGQQIVVGGLHFTMLRVLVLVACVRVMVRGEFRRLQWLRLDTMIVAWVLAGVVTYTILWASADALVNRLGIAYDALGLYFIFRFVLRDLNDVKRTCGLFAMALIPLALAMGFERLTGRDPFYVFGGVPELTQMREGVLRCQGPFAHPILAGTFGAVCVPLLIGLWLQGKNQRVLASAGIVSGVLITFFAGSSGPVGSLAAGILACAMWKLRYSMKAVRWGIVALLMVAQVVMKAPVWFVFARVNLFSGSTGWHRANLIDQTIAHFSDWWLLGVKETYSWGVWGGDITNQFILQGIRGGLATMILFIGIVVVTFSAIGRTLRSMRADSRRAELLLWAIGATTFAHVISFMNVSYFDQNIVSWYLLLAMVATAFSVCVQKKTRLVQSKTNSEPNVLDPDEAMAGLIP